MKSQARQTINQTSKHAKVQVSRFACSTVWLSVAGLRDKVRTLFVCLPTLRRQTNKHAEASSRRGPRTGALPVAEQLNACSLEVTTRKKFGAQRLCPECRAKGGGPDFFDPPP